MGKGGKLTIKNKSVLAQENTPQYSHHDMVCERHLKGT